MERLPLLLRWYCILAIILLAWYGFTVSSQVRSMKQRTAEMVIQLEGLNSETDKAEDVYNQLEGKQRRERPGYSGEEAVMASVAVMSAKDKFEKLSAELKQLQEQHNQLEISASALQLRIVPVVAIALLHLFGFFMIRVEQREK
ncbi:hypothetical protein KDL29_00340 [bacterium]|nr:hypothetical protein [bacterium]